MLFITNINLSWLHCLLDLYSFSQLCRLFMHLMDPIQKKEVKFFALQLTKLNRANSIFLNMLLGGITTKVGGLCAGSILQYVVACV